MSPKQFPKPAHEPRAQAGRRARDEALSADLEQSPDTAAAVRALLAGLDRLARSATAEAAWRAAGFKPTAKAACYAPRVASLHGWIELVSTATATEPRAHAGIVRVWRLTPEGRRRAGI